jgi:formylglycine-generating enzyme required for sulfatase activity
LSAYRIDTYPVTNTEYKVFLDETGHELPPHWTSGTYQADQSDQPAINVSWDDAQAYAKWAGKRLPTESEWEKASRGREGQIYPWGNTFWTDFCNSSNNYGGTTPVGLFPGGSSPYGVVDTVGNVFEWRRGPEGPGAESGEKRSMRGGFHGAFGKYLRCAYRGWAPQENKQDHVGFRCAMDVTRR